MRDLICIQSISDIITNSSSELFVLDDRYSTEEVDAVLSEIITGYMKPFIFSIDTFRKVRNLIAECETVPEELDQYRPLVGWYLDPQIEDDRIYICTSYIEAIDRSGFFDLDDTDVNIALKLRKYLKGELLTYDNVTDIVTNKVMNDTDLVSEILSNNEEFNAKLLDGKIIVISKDENSIKYKNGEWYDDNDVYAIDKVLDTLNGSHVHLG